MREINVKLEIFNFSRLTFHWHLLSFAVVPIVHKQKELDKFVKLSYVNVSLYMLAIPSSWCNVYNKREEVYNNWQF